MQQALLQIAQAPERWPILVDELRKRPLRGFPHRVIYAVRRDHVLIVAVMQRQGLTNLASHDTDFDRVLGLTRYGPT